FQLPRLIFLAVFLLSVFPSPAGAIVAAQANTIWTQVETPLPAPGAVIVVFRNDVFTAASDVAAASDVDVTQTYSSVVNGFASTVDASTLRELALDPMVAIIVADSPVEPFAQITPTNIKRTGISK
ncbi:MAG: protease inhibitor I9 family protein, partial [Thermomicrobiales bacterium]